MGEGSEGTDAGTAAGEAAGDGAQSAEAAGNGQQGNADGQPAVQETHTGDEENTESQNAAAETAAPLPAIDFENILTEGTGLWKQTPENTWKKITKKTELAPQTNVLVRLAYELPAGSLDAGNAQTVYELPEELLINKDIAKNVNADENYLNQIITGIRLPDEEPGADEYLAGKYELKKNKETKRWEIRLTWNTWTVQENANAKQTGWLMFYLTGADLQTDSDGHGRVLFAKKDADDEKDKKIETKYTVTAAADAESEEPAAESAEGETSAEEAGAAETTETVIPVEEPEVYLQETEESSLEENGDGETSETDESSLEETTAEETTAEETTVEETTEEAPIGVAGQLTVSDADYTVTVTYGEEAGLPEGVTLAVKEIAEDGSAYDEYKDQAQEALSEEKEVRIQHARFFDITFLVDGEEVQPVGPVDVKIEFAKAADVPADAEVKAVHLPESEDAEVLDVQQEEAGKGEEISFTAEGFSVYGVVYTVDFEYSVNGKMYQFSLPGGEKITLSDLVEVLGIIGDTNSGEKAAFNSVEDFFKEVANVQFSDESLVKVVKNEEGNDWTLESLQPFDTEESLTITMKNGDVVTVKVTDSQAGGDLAAFVTDATLVIDGKTYGAGTTWNVRPNVDYKLTLNFLEKGSR